MKTLIVVLLSCLSIQAQTRIVNANIKNATISITNATVGGSTTFVTAGRGVTLINNVGGTFRNGFRFTANANITVTDLGRYVVSGNSQTHVIYLFDSLCGELASCTVNTSGQPAGAYTFNSITPVSLTSGQIYFIMSVEPDGGDQFYSDDGTLTTTVDGTITQASYYDNNCHTTESGSVGYGPVNFKYTKP